MSAISIEREEESTEEPAVETVVAAAVGMALYHDRLGLWGILGILLVLVSIGVMNLPDPKKQGKTRQITGK